MKKGRNIMYFRPAEWRKEKTIWLAWPFDEDLWGDDLKGAQNEFLALVAALSLERVVIVFPNKHELEEATLRMNPRQNLACKIVPYADIWLRDTLPIFVKDERGKTTAVIPRFNGWGGKYLFENDRDLSVRISDLLLMPRVFSSVTFEGGAIESDGAGTLLTTEQCLLNKNRNPKLSRKEIEEEFLKIFGAKKVIWLKEGLLNDHTDGHIDTIARFIGPERIAVMKPESKSDPNYDALTSIIAQLTHETDAHGNGFELVEIPSPGRVVDSEGKIMPASYLNFILGDETLVVPLYGTPYDDDALSAYRKALLDLRVVGVGAKAILSGGGAFHCISQEIYR